MRALEVEVSADPVGRIHADTIVVPIPGSERPLRGAAGRLDWRMCGRISEEILSGALSGRSHEAVLLAARPPLVARRVMLLGIGAGASLPGIGIQDTFRDLTARLLGLQSQRAVVALPGAIDLEEDAQPALRGCLHGVSAFRDEATLRLVLCGQLPLLRSLTRAVDGIAEEAERRQVRLAVEASAPEVFAAREGPLVSPPVV